MMVTDVNPNNISGTMQRQGGPVETKARSEKQLAQQAAHRAKMAQQSLDRSLDCWTKIAQALPYGKTVETSIKEVAAQAGIGVWEVASRTELFKTLGLVEFGEKKLGSSTLTPWTIAKKKYEGAQLIEEWYGAGNSLNQFNGHSGQKRMSKKQKAVVAAQKVAEMQATERRDREAREQRQRDEAAREEALIEATEHAKEEVAQAIETFATNGVHMDDHVAVRTEHDEPVEAIAGPEPTSPFEALRAIRKNEPEAMIAAARQYAGRQEAVNRTFAQLESLGVKIDYKKAMEAVSFDRDEVLEVVASLLPYIDGLEAKVFQISEWKQEIVTLRKETGQLRDMYNREKDANKRLSERNARLAAAAN